MPWAEEEMERLVGRRLDAGAFPSEWQGSHRCTGGSRIMAPEGKEKRARRGAGRAPIRRGRLALCMLAAFHRLHPPRAGRAASHCALRRRHWLSSSVHACRPTSTRTRVPTREATKWVRRPTPEPDHQAADRWLVTHGRLGTLRAAWCSTHGLLHGFMKQTKQVRHRP